MQLTKIFVVTHKQVEISKKRGYIPLVVGNGEIKYDFCVRDNTGDNIAEKNSNYCELTGLYWIWKNISSDMNVGLCHYRRYFIKKTYSKKWEDIISTEDLDKILKKCDVILPYPRSWFDKTVEDWFLGTDGKKEDLIKLRKVIGKKYPEYLEEYDNVMNGKSASYLNMFVMNKKLLDKYCEWLFDILFELEKHIDLTCYTPLEARIYGFLGERLFNVWIKKNKLKVKYLQVLETEKPSSYKAIFKEILKNNIMRYECLKIFRKCRWGYMNRHKK